MSKYISILDKDYIQWVEYLSMRYRQSQVRASVKVNREILSYYGELGRDIEEMHVEERWGQGVIKTLANDLQHRNPNATGLSRTNIYYAKKFYLLHSQYFNIIPQMVEQLELNEVLFSIPWWHHRFLIYKYSKEPANAFYYVRKTMEEEWSRDIMLNHMDAKLYE